MTMLKANHKRRATTLSKAIFTAGLLGGTALSTLAAGSAQAVGWVPSFLQQTTTPPPLGPGHPFFNIATTSWIFDQGSTPGFNFAAGVCTETDPVCMSPVIADKQVTLLGWTSLPGDPTSNPQLFSNLEFSLNPGDQYPWHVDLNLNPGDQNGGNLAYKIAIVPPVNNDLCASSVPPVICGPLFHGVRLSSSAAITKVYGTGYDALAIDPFDSSLGVVTGVIDTLDTPLSPDFGLGGPSVLYVKDYWNGVQTVNKLENAYNQVPAPLPFLGVGAAFGSIRKLRKFSSQLKTFSMG
jgi:hypothetical protein